MKGVTADGIIAQELAKMQNRELGDGSSSDIDAGKLIYSELSKDFPDEAMQEDSSRGFALTSVKAQYVVERLNESFGIMNWSFGGEFKEVEGGILYMGGLVITINGRQNKHFAPGFAKLKKNVGDSYKSAQTDSLSKCASKFGVANSVFKGLVDAKSLGKPKTTARAKKITAVETTTVPEDTSFATRTGRTRKRAAATDEI